VLFRSAVRGWRGSLRVAFYEVGYVLPPDVLVDITPVADVKASAIAAYRSQLDRLDYLAVADGLARFRSLTLGGEARAAEAFRLTDARRLDSDPIWRWQALQDPPRSAADRPAVSVVVRTKDRPKLLREALESLAAQTFRDFEVVLVNDGGRSVDDVASQFPNLRLNAITLPENRGRAAAANAGVAAARGEFIAYLDDDDVYYPPHLETLHRFLAEHDHFVAAYTDAHSAKYRLNAETSAYELVERAIEHSQDFDPDLLLFQNYIHNFCLMHRRDAWQRLGGFDEHCAFLEDWDFFIRLTEIGPFQHLARCTAEYRQRDDGTNISQRALGAVVEEANSRIDLYRRHWQRHSPERLRRVYDRLRGEAWHAKHWAAEAARLGRDRDAALVDVARMNARADDLDAKVRELVAVGERLTARIRELEERLRERDVWLEEKDAGLKEKDAGLEEKEARLQMIYGSRTWKLYLFFDAITRQLRGFYRRLKRLFGQSALPET